ncbi:hypothetical protein NDU88_005168 [Pleurodeles waltl]|uniref:Uncharacterized protein n=1 Tax=Pleurodeles waltl TaxID=8319 RepID=A0AAV7QH25_PLEWA|nr:hypothetical protein NDU88_005168 [Pleurodeles waltl]
MTAVAPPTGWRCTAGHSDRGRSAAARNGKSAVYRRLSAALENPPWRRSALRRHGDSDTPYRHPTLKFATGATAPVALQQLRRLHSEPASSLLGLSRCAGGRPFGGRPPAQRESQNGRRGLVTAVRSFGGNRMAGGDRRPPRLESPPTCIGFALRVIDTMEELKNLQSNVDKEEKNLRLWRPEAGRAIGIRRWSNGFAK